MDEYKVDAVLRHYPQLYNYTLSARANILYRYRQGPASVVRSAGTNDITGEKAIELIDAAAGASLLIAVRRWIDSELPAEFRPLLLDVWRGLPWSVIAKKQGQEVGPCQEDFASLVGLLEKHLTHSVGLVCGQDGIAFVLGPGRLQADLGT